MTTAKAIPKWIQEIRPKMNNTDCQKIKCEDYLTDGGEPAWCFRAGCPAVVAAGKCPKLQGEGNGRKDDVKRHDR